MVGFFSHPVHLKIKNGQVLNQTNECQGCILEFGVQILCMHLLWQMKGCYFYLHTIILLQPCGLKPAKANWKMRAPYAKNLYKKRKKKDMGIHVHQRSLSVLPHFPGFIYRFPWKILRMDKKHAIFLADVRKQMVWNLWPHPRFPCSPSFKDPYQSG